MDSKSEQSLDEGALDEQIRAHFRTERAGSVVPTFEALLAQAEAERVGRSSFSWRQWLSGMFPVGRGALVGTGAAALALLLLVYVTTDSGIDSDRSTHNDQMLAAIPAVVTISEEELVADLNSTLRWQAPSDRWLVVAEADVNVYGLPDFSNPAANLKEMDRWM